MNITAKVFGQASLPPRRVRRRRVRPEIWNEPEAVTAPKAAKLATKAAKPSTKVAKPATKVAKPATKVAECAPKVTKTEVESPEADNDGIVEKTRVKEDWASKPKVAPNAEGLYELEPVMAKAVEEQLNDVMNLVWQELPVAALSVMNRMIVDKFKKDIAHDIENAVGLNLSKRLLNVFNPLFIKVEFSVPPQQSYLKKFINACNCVLLKPLQGSQCLYVAQIRTVQEFDRLCQIKRLRCGDARATIFPCYKFTQSPPNVKTIYNDFSWDKKDTSINEQETETQNKQDNKTEKTANEKTPSKSDTIKDTIKPAAKVKANEKTPTKSVSFKGVFKKDVSKSAAKKPQNDNDELDDEDILALLSNGIVVDECSGTDEES